MIKRCPLHWLSLFGQTNSHASLIIGKTCFLKCNMCENGIRFSCILYMSKNNQQNLIKWASKATIQKHQRSIVNSQHQSKVIKNQSTFWIKDKNTFKGTKSKTTKKLSSEKFEQVNNDILWKPTQKNLNKIVDFMSLKWHLQERYWKKKTHNKNKNTMTCFFKKTTFYNGMPLQQAAAKVM